MPPVVGVYKLERGEPRPVERGGDRQVRARLRDPHDLDLRPAGQRDHLAGQRRVGVHYVLRHRVQQVDGAIVGHSGHHQLGPVVRGEAHRVRKGRPVPSPLHPLHNPAILFEQVTQVLKVVLPGGTGMITLPAHVVTSDIQATIKSL